MSIINSACNYTLSSYNIQEKDRCCAFNSYKNELGERALHKNEVK